MDTQKFDFFDAGAFKQFTNPAQIEKDLQTLVGILEGIKSDHLINQVEHQGVLEWVNQRKNYENKQPYDHIISKIKSALADDVLTFEECDDIIWMCEQYIEHNGYYNQLTLGIQKLLGIVQGISLDNLIKEVEIRFLDQWLKENDYLKNTYPYDELYAFTTYILDKKVVERDVHEKALQFMNALSCSSSSSSKVLVDSLNANIWQLDPEVIIPEKTFCITGISIYQPRKAIAEKVELFGGYVTDNIVQSLDYLVVCSQKNECWAFTSYGRKVEKAVELRKKGKQINIIHENDLYDAFENYS